MILPLFEINIDARESLERVEKLVRVVPEKIVEIFEKLRMS